MLQRLLRLRSLLPRGGIEALEDAELESDTESEFLNFHAINSLYMAPFHIKGKMMGFVSVDNVAAHLGEVIFLNAMAYFIPNEIVKRRLMSEQDYVKHYDMLTELENRNAESKKKFSFVIRQIYQLSNNQTSRELHPSVRKELFITARIVQAPD